MVTVLVALLVPVVATASACEICKQAHQYVLVHGKSPNGVPWRITTVGPRTDSFGRRGVVFHFDFGPPAPPDVGYSSGMPLPVPAGFAFSGNSGSDIDPYPESDLSGIVGRGIRRLRVKLSEGEPLEFRPVAAPASIRSRFPFLRGLRFYDAFYAAGPKPMLVEAFDSGGRFVARAASELGSFSALRRP